MDAIFTTATRYYPQATPSNPSTPLIGQLDAKSNNYYLIKPDQIRAFIYEKHGRYFKGSAAVAVPCFSYSHAPTLANATLGSLDFSVVDQVRASFSHAKTVMQYMQKSLTCGGEPTTRAWTSSHWRSCLQWSQNMAR